jgi:hypothetical protein
MTRNDIIEMAKEIAVQYGKSERFQTWTHDFMMQRLMELVTVSAATEREACAVLCDQLSDTSLDLRFGAAIRARGQA